MYIYIHIYILYIYCYIYIYKIYIYIYIFRSRKNYMFHNFEFHLSLRVNKEILNSLFMIVIIRKASSCEIYSFFLFLIPNTWINISLCWIIKRSRYLKKSWIELQNSIYLCLCFVLCFWITLERFSILFNYFSIFRTLW